MLEGTILLSVPEHLQRDVDVFPLHIITDCPLKVIPLREGDVPAYPQLKEKLKEWPSLTELLF